jgi:hypothetical protein
VSNWIRFHAELRKGKHRGVPRALRFVFLELCLEARPGRGTVELPLGMDLLDGVHDLLGGNRREVQQALEIYLAGPDPEAPTLVTDGPKGSLRLVIPSWEKWNPIDSSAERMRRLRENRALKSAGDASRDVTPCDAVTALDQSRGDQIRSDPPLAPPPGGQTPTGAQGALPGVEAPPKVGKRRTKAKAESGPMPEGWAPNEKHFELARKLGFGRERVVEECGRFIDHHAAKGSGFVDWNAAFGTWIRNEAKWAKERANGRGSSLQPAAKPGEFNWRNPGEYRGD